MTLGAGIDDIAPVIQLSVAPVFLLTAVAAMIGVHINRLARTVDRTRAIEERQAGGADADMAPLLGELKVLQSRMRLIYLAITLDVTCALFVGLTIVTAFSTRWSRPICPG